MPINFHGAQQVGWWDGHAAPTTGPTGTATTWVGVKLAFPAPGRVFGVQFYGPTGAATGNYTAGGICPDRLGYPDKMELRAYTSPDNATVRWNHMWFKRPYPVVTTQTYRIAVLYRGGGLYRTNNALTSAVTRNGIQFLHGFQSTALDMWGLLVTENANANAVDVLFQPD